ncbi:MAG TPA: YciI family protein [Rhizomicrobium sp.]
MMLMIPGGYESAAPGTMPDPAHVEKMMAFNKAMMDAGILLSADGLHPPSMGVRVSFKGGKPLVTDGRFAETKEVLGGYWIIDVASRGEAIAWASRCPAQETETIEVRQIQEFADFPPEVQKVVAA